MLKKVKIKSKIKAKDFLKYLNSKQKKQLIKLSRFLKDKKIIHINATDLGGGVAEILKSFVPYLRALGIKIDWYVINPSFGEKLFVITNKIHDALQSMPAEISRKQWEFYEKVNKKIAEDLKKIKCDVLVINDPQPLFAKKYLDDNKAWIYRSHVDTSTAYKKVWNKVLPVIREYDGTIFSNKAFVHKSFPKNKVHIFTPAIDPLSLKQKIVSKNKAKRYLKHRYLPIKFP